ncbi:D-lyxose/D-mannose family sugar isomerase [Tunturiibacter empetritectus]|uniref:D-lyxose ketol-isomerase n=2 Tax=Tunturiibacter TaxID=3154218 RepID=A0A852VRU2_9BACT|nr:D-lyxose/D-mannose family sugar isomerase [Edaphobacter lichenicola]NYF92256.1 D-lyxose ketol-isomerase [Edaphobacter lichenicola]
MKRDEVLAAQSRAAQVLNEAGIVLTASEAANIEVADLGLNHLEVEGLELVTYINTSRYCAKELVLFARQTFPEHRHPPFGDNPGKDETFRCLQGLVWLYVEGVAAETIQSQVPKESAPYYTVFHEVELRPGEQYTIPHNTLHWFQGGPEGAVVSEFSSASRDEFDIFTDPRIQRVAQIGD